MVTFEDLQQNPDFQEWQEGHRLGMAATLCLDGHPSLDVDRALDLIAAYLEPIPDHLAHVRSSALLKLPLYTLERMLQLAQLPSGDDLPLPDAVTKKADCISRVIDRLTQLNPDTPETVCAQRVMEQTQMLVFNSNYEAEHLGRLFVRHDEVFRLSSDSWRDGSESLQDELQTLRSPWIDGPSTLDRVSAALSLGGQLMVEQPNNWWIKRFKFGLMDRIMAWPMLVIRHGSEVRESDLSLSLPVGVDIKERNDGGGAEVRHVCGAPRVVDPDGWSVSSGRIVRNVASLFRYSRAIRGACRIDRQCVTLDFRFADEILRPLLDVMPLSDRSMEAYLTSVILSRSLGQPVSPSTLITGEIVDVVASAVDVELRWPGGVSAKIDYAFATGIADRVVIPTGHSEVIGQHLDKVRELQRASVVHVRRLSQAVTIAVGPTASPHRFIRCPEIALADGRPLADDLLTQAQIESVRQALKDDSVPFIDISNHMEGADLTAREVHLALRRLEVTGGKPLAWLFIRIHEDEDDDALWELIGEGMGAASADIDRLIRAGAPTKVAKGLASLLGPGGIGSHLRFIVLIGGSERWQVHEHRVRCHALKPVLQEWARLSGPDHGNARCRIILAPALSKEAEIAVPSNPADEPEWLDRLRVFRCGFDRACAAFLLKDLQWRGSDLREKLEKAVADGWLHKLPDGDYLVTSGRGDPVKTRDPRALAQLHHAAAQSLASLLAYNLKRAGLPKDETTKVMNVLEACHHFRSAIRHDKDWQLPEKGSPNGEPEKIERQNQFLFVHKYYRRHSISTLACAELLSDAPDVMLRSIEREISRLAQEETVLHPFISAWPKEYIRAVLRNLPPGSWANFSATLDRVFQLFENSLKACESATLSDGRNYLICTVVSRLDSAANMLLNDRVAKGIVKPQAPRAADQYRRDDLAQKLKALVVKWCNSLRLDDLNDTVKEILLADAAFELSDAPLGEWCERIVRDEPAPMRALKIAAHGVKGSPEWITLWPWFFGALEEALETPSTADVEKIVRELERSVLEQLQNNDELFTKVSKHKTHSDPLVGPNKSPFAALLPGNPSARHERGLGYIQRHLSSKARFRARMGALTPEVAYS